MPWNLGPSVNQYKGRDCWRTWFWEECEREGLYGLTDRHLPLVTHHGDGVVPYEAGTQLRLEDAPYFKATGKTVHRVCGPYEVVALHEPELPKGARRVFPEAGPVIVYEDLEPQRGPWLDSSYVRRNIEGVDARFQKQATRFHCFPYRFAIRPRRTYKIEHFPHREDCPLCR